MLEEYDERDRNTLQEMMRRTTIYTDLAKSICPSVYGNDNVKQAILLMLFGGVHKRTKEVRMHRVVGTNPRLSSNSATVSF